MQVSKNKISQEKVISQFIIKHNSRYDYSNVSYVRDNIKIDIVCKTHGLFQQTPSNHKRGQGCPKCKGKSLNKEELILSFKNVHGDRFDYSKVNYVKNNLPVIITCKTHGDFLQTPNAHKSGNGCKICSGLYKPTIKELIAKFQKIHGDSYNYDKVKYTTAHAKITISCRVHGDFLQTPNNHKNGNGCPTCCQSHGENEVSRFLDTKNFVYLKQHKFPDCKNILKLPFDFYIPHLNTCIEFHGLQHFKSIEHFGGITQFKIRKRNDKIKKEYCRNNNIPLMIIKYNDNLISKLKLL